MRKILVLSLLLVSFLNTNAQLSFESTGKYGKLWDITYDLKIPNRLYAHTLVNHIMVSNNNGASWEVFYSFPNSLTHIEQLKLLPGGRYMSFATGTHPDPEENGVYVLDLKNKTIRQHFKLPNRYLRPAVRSYSIYDAEARTVLVNTSYSLGFIPFTEVYYTKNASEDWKLVYFSDDYNTVQINNCFIYPGNPSRLFLSRGPGARDQNGGLFISDDEGSTWTEQLKDIVLDPVTFNPRNPKEFFAGTGISSGQTSEALYHTHDGGKTFRKIPVKWTDQTLNNINIIQYDPVNPAIMWMLEENEILKSTDGGRTWASTAFGPDNEVYTFGTSLTINPYNSKKLFICSDGWPQYSSNGGKTLSQVSNPFHLASGVAVGDYAWKQQLYYTTLGGYLSKDLYGHKTKAYDVKSPFLINIRELTVIADPSVQGRLFVYKPSDAYLNRAELHYSDDYGATLIKLPVEEFSSALKVVQKDPNKRHHYWLAYTTSGSSSLSVLDIKNAVSTPVTTPGEGIINGIAVLPGNIIYIAQGASIYRSDDGGLTWNERNHGLEGVEYIWDLKVNPLDNKSMAIATTNGIYKATTAEDNWSLLLHDGDLKKIAFSDVVNGHIIAASYTSLSTETKLVYSSNGGERWSEVPPAKLGYLQCMTDMDFRFHYDRADVYFATSDLGVVKYQLKGLFPHYLSQTEQLSMAEQVKEKASQPEWSVYPVPATTNINISAKGITTPGVYFVTIMDIYGKQYGTRQYNLAAGTTTVNLPVSHLANGIYIMSIRSGYGEPKTFKFLKQ